MSDLTVGNPVSEENGNPNGTATDANGTSNGVGEARQGAATTETFIPEGIDLNTLPPNVRQYVEKINNDMVRGFTEKTTKLSETVKAEVAKSLEPYRSKAEQYEQIAAQEEFVKQWNEYVQKSQSQNQNPQNPGDPLLKEMKSQLEEMNMKIQLSEMSQITEAFAEAVNEKGERLHPEFDTLNDIVIGQFGEKSEPFSLLRAAVELAQGGTPSEKLANGYKAAKAAHDAIFELGRKAGLGRVQTKIANGTQPASHSLGDTMSVTDKKPKNAREALEMARKGVMVSRE